MKHMIVLLTMLVVLIISCLEFAVSYKLDPSYYSSSCANVLPVVKRVVARAMQQEAQMGASLLRLHFHDCFVNGCDGSILLDDGPDFVGEKTAAPNLNSARGFHVVDAIKAELEGVCSNTVSCADILAIAARDAVSLSGGPFWNVELGRRDGTTASKAAADNSIPTPLFDVRQLVSTFNAVGLLEQDVVVLAGAHTIGKARCPSFQERLYNQSGTGQPDPSLETSYLHELQHLCPDQNGDSNLNTILDLCTPTSFDNQYYKNLQAGKGLLFSDEVLFTTHGHSLSLVNLYANSQEAFFNDFETSMLKMGRTKVLTGNHGQVRKNCRIVNAGH